MATTTPNFGWAVPTSTDLVKDGAVAIETLGDAIDASLVDLKGGTTNQVLAKNSNTDMDFKWVADASGIPATIIDAKGDLIAGTAADTAARLAVGTNGQVLTADSAEATGLKWATAGASSGPAFSARAATGQNVTANTATKVTFGTEDFDTAGNFASSRFTPTTAGYYQINCSVTTSTDSANYHETWIYKNGTFSVRVGSFGSILNGTGSGGVVIYFNGSSDYVECYTRVGGTNTRIDSGDGQTVFSGVWIRS
jgi:hypothetical protein